MLSEGERTYLEFSKSYKYGYIEIEKDGFSFAEINAESSELLEKESSVEVAFTAMGTAIGMWGNCSDEYEYLLQMLVDSLDGCDTFECTVLKNGEDLYGAVNCYNRASGRSGSMLSNEDLDRGYLFEVENGEIKFVTEAKDTAILAFNQSHYIAYKDKAIYSVNRETGAETELCKDIWWDMGPTYYSDVNVEFSEDYFVLYGRLDKVNVTRDTVIVCKMDGTHFTRLVDNQEV